MGIDWQRAASFVPVDLAPSRPARIGLPTLDQLSDLSMPEIVEATFRRGPDAPDEADGKGFEEFGLVLWGHRNDAVGFGHLRGDLGQVFRAGDANGQWKADFVATCRRMAMAISVGAPKRRDRPVTVEEGLHRSTPVRPGG